MNLPSDPQIQTVIDDIDANYGKVDELPIYTLFYKVHLYPFIKSFDRWMTEIDIAAASFIKRYKSNPDPALGNAIAVFDEFRRKYSEARKYVLCAMQSLQPKGTNVKAIIDDMERQQEKFKEKLVHIDRLVEAFGPIQDDIPVEDIAGINS